MKNKVNDFLEEMKNKSNEELLELIKFKHKIQPNAAKAALLEGESRGLIKKEEIEDKNKVAEYEQQKATARVKKDKPKNNKTRKVIESFFWDSVRNAGILGIVIFGIGILYYEKSFSFMLSSILKGTPLLLILGAILQIFTITDENKKFW